MSNTVIDIENVGKQYMLGTFGTGTLSHDLNRWWARIRGKEDPYLRIGDTNDRTKKSDSNFVWALRDINVKIEEGDVVGIIGKNGASRCCWALCGCLWPAWWDGSASVSFMPCCTLPTF